jgi:trigger factor
MDVPDYKNITLSEELVTRLVNTELAYFYHGKEIDTEVFEPSCTWDIVEISFTGFIDGETDEELCASNYLLLLGSETFYVDGFEQGLIGKTRGETVGLNLKFSDDYPSDKYAGKDVSYSVEIHAVYRAPALSDELCREHTAFDSAGEYKEFVKKSCVYRYVWDTLTSKCSIKKYPDEYTEYYHYFKTTFQNLAEESELSFAEFISQYGDRYGAFGLFSGMSVADFEAVATDYAKSNVVNDLLTYSIIRLEGIKTEGAEYDKALEQLEKETGKTYERLVSETDEKSVIISVLNVRLCDVIYGYVKIENN